MNFSGKYGSSPRISALSAPPRPARPQPNAKVKANTCGTLMPSPIAARGSSTAARSRLPKRFRASLLGLAGILHRVEGCEFHVVELAVDLLDLADIDVLHDVARFRVDR